jgi:predicted ATPase
VITRIEIDGFKSFDEFGLELRPFNVLVGPNNGGKSNLLEAVDLLAELLDRSDRPLFERRRGTGTQLFRQRLDGEAVSEFVVRAEMSDRPAPGESTTADTAWALVRQTPDGLAVGRKRPENVRLYHQLIETVQLAPVPERMRSGAALDDRGALVHDGSNLAAVLGRIADAGLMGDLEMAAGFVIEDLYGIRPNRYPAIARWEFELVFGGRGTFPAALVSDGTLRILALLAAVYDPRGAAIVLVDELETGLHPAYQRRLVEILRRQAEGHRDLPSPQIIATTHSPVVLAAVLDGEREDAVFLNQAAGRSPRQGALGGERVHTRARRIADSGEPGTYISRWEVQQYLDSTRPESVVLR